MAKPVNVETAAPAAPADPFAGKTPEQIVALANSLQAEAAKAIRAAEAAKSAVSRIGDTLTQNIRERLNSKTIAELTAIGETRFLVTLIPASKDANDQIVPEHFQITLGSKIALSAKTKTSGNGTRGKRSDVVIPAEGKVKKYKEKEYKLLKVDDGYTVNGVAVKSLTAAYQWAYRDSHGLAADGDVPSASGPSWWGLV